MVRRDVLENWLNAYLVAPGVRDYTENGLQVAGKMDISRIVAAVSINLEVIERAIAEGADAVLVHHGLFWNNDERSLRGYRRQRIKRILEHDINVYAYHLPLDFHHEISHNRLILKAVGADSIEGPETFLRKKLGTEDVQTRVPAGGLVGIFKDAVGFNDLVERVNRMLRADTRCFHFGSERVETLFVVSGAGRNELDRVLELGVDAFLTGDAKESTPYIVKEAGFNYLYAGHYSTERLGVIELGNRIQEVFDIDVRFIDVANPL